MNESWDVELAYALYAGGMKVSDILLHPKFRGIPPQRMYERARNERWAEKRDEIRAILQIPYDSKQAQKGRAITNAARTLQERLMEEGIRHQEFMMSELHRERKIFENRPKDEETQMERMQILEKIDNVARKTSKLDEEKSANPITQGFAFLVHMQAKSGHSATLTLQDDSEASMGILSSNNAHVELPIEAEIVVSEEPGPDLKQMPLPGSLFGAKPL